MAMLPGVRLVVNVDLSKYPFFSGKIENFSLLPTQGFCNENYSFQMDSKTYLFRKFKEQNVDRKFEFKVQNLAYEKKIAAKAILLDEENGLMICEFLEGHHKDTLDRNNLIELANLLKKLHTIQIDREPLNVEELFDNKSPELIKVFDTVKNHQSENVLCHNDLNPKNILFSNDIKFIDWEYASINDRYFDLASVSVEFSLNQKDETYFLAAYFNSSEEIQIEKLNAYKMIYRDLCKQWFNKHV